MIIKLKSDQIHDTYGPLSKGQEVEVDDAYGKHLIKVGLAREITGKETSEEEGQEPKKKK